MQANGHEMPNAPDDGAAILDGVHAFIGRFVAYPSPEAHDAHTLWIAHTHAMDAWESTPRLALLSPEPGSGKTRGLEVSEPLVPRPVEAINVSPSYLFRKMGDPKGRPTILYDEIDTVFGPMAKKDNEEIRGLPECWPSQGRRRRPVRRRRRTGDNRRSFPAYCAVALAGLGNLPSHHPDALRGCSECVAALLTRRWRHGGAASMRSRLLRASTVRLGVSGPRPRSGKIINEAGQPMPDGVTDRDADVWEALLAVADARGRHHGLGALDRLPWRWSTLPRRTARPLASASLRISATPSTRSTTCPAPPTSCPPRPCSGGCRHQQGALGRYQG